MTVNASDATQIDKVCIWAVLTPLGYLKMVLFVLISVVTCVLTSSFLYIYLKGRVRTSPNNRYLLVYVTSQLIFACSVFVHSILKCKVGQPLSKNIFVAVLTFSGFLRFLTSIVLLLDRFVFIKQGILYNMERNLRISTVIIVACVSLRSASVYTITTVSNSQTGGIRSLAVSVINLSLNMFKVTLFIIFSTKLYIISNSFIEVENVKRARTLRRKAIVTSVFTALASINILLASVHRTMMALDWSLGEYTDDILDHGGLLMSFPAELIIFIFSDRFIRESMKRLFRKRSSKISDFV